MQEGIIFKEHISKVQCAVKSLFAFVSNEKNLLSDYVFKVQKELFKKEFSVDRLSKQVFISKYHLVRTFKQQTGITMHQFYMQNRIRWAKKLLKQKNNITKVAIQSDFYDQSHFCRWFKKLVGITPRKFILAQRFLH